MLAKRFSIICLLFICFWLIQPLAAQSYLNLDVAQNFSTFKFTHDPLESDDISSPSLNYSQISTTAFGVGYKCLHSSGIFAEGGLGFRKAGASLVYKKINYLWNLQYIDLKAGVGYQYNKWRIRPYTSVMPYYAYLLNGKQSIGLNYYDIKSDKALKNFDLGLFFNLGANVTLSQYIAIYAQYSYNLGLKNIEPATDQYLYNRGFALKIGLSINISNFRSKEGNIPMQSYNNAVDKNLDNFTQPKQNTEVALINNADTQQNSANSSNNSTTKNEANEGTQKIVSPGTVGWSSNTPSQSKSNTTSEELTSDETYTQETRNSAQANDNSVKTNVSGFETPSDANLPKTANTQTTRAVETNSSNNLIAQSNSGPSKATSSKSNSNYGTVKPTPDTEIKLKKVSSDDKIVFKVQLTAVKNSLRSSHPILKEIKGNIKAEKGRDGWMRYYLGTYKTYAEAQKELKKIKAKGIAEGSFIVAFKNGKKITVAEAKELAK